MFDILKGKHIVLRKAKETDWQPMLANVWSDEAVYRWMLFQPTLTEAEARYRCARSISFQKENFAWFIALRDTDEAIGMCAIREEKPGCFEECGICLGTKYQWKGYGKETVTLLLDLVFRELGAETVRYGYDYDNIKSKKSSTKFPMSAAS